MDDTRSRASPRLQFTKEELENPALERPIAKAEKAAKKPFVPLTGRTPESIPSHLDLHEASQKTTKRPQENTQEVASDE